MHLGMAEYVIEYHAYNSNSKFKFKSYETLLAIKDERTDLISEPFFESRLG